MNKKIFALTALLFLITCISAVNAEDIDQTNDTLEIDDSDILSAAKTGTFSDLADDITASISESRLNIEKDYKFNNETDKGLIGGITLTFDVSGDYIIEGNNHVIDANRQAGIFKFNNGNVHINNLKFINSARTSIILTNCKLYTNNVTFENNYDPGDAGAVYAETSVYYSKHDKFINNYAKNGASIQAIESTLEIDNSTFISDKEIGWGLIYTYDTKTSIKNTVFANMTSKYATAIYCEKNLLEISNSKFINLFAQNTAGAIGLKETHFATIDNCSFINTSSTKNGGAIFADIDETTKLILKGVLVKNSLFENCSSEFGGAYLQLGGYASIMDTDFISNTAKYSGGAIYLSATDSLMGNLKLDRNGVEHFNGGALFIDNSALRISSSNITNNVARGLGSGIYLYDSKYNIKDSYFADNNNQVIVSYFDKENSTLTNNDLNGGETLLNQESYIRVVDYDGKQIILNPTKINETSKSSKFDLRKYNLTGPVKNQGNMGSCWAFAATGALESAFLKETGILLDLSENNVQNSGLRYSEIGSNIHYEGAYSTTGMGLFVSWFGIISVNDDAYDELGKISLSQFTNDSYHIQDTVIIPKRKNALDNEKLKEALINYGGLTVHIYGATANNNYYNKDTHAQYYNGPITGNHFVTLVGWDDKYSKDNFLIKPKGDGAWICKNSWGSKWGEEGYFYVSYYDTSLARATTSVGYILNNTEAYVRAYQYDIGGIDMDYYKSKDGNDLRYVNTYTAVYDELISAVGTYFETPGEKYTVTIFVDGKAVYSQSGSSTHGGFETIKLNDKLAVNFGHKFSVEIKTKQMPIMSQSRLHFEKGNSIVYYPDKSSDDLILKNSTASIKVYTFSNENPTKTKSQYYDKNKKVTVKSNAKKVSVMKNNTIIGTATVKNGEATFDFELSPGVYGLLNSYDNHDDDFVELFEIMNTIIAVDSITMELNDDDELNVEFLDENGVNLVARDITYQLDGKKHKDVIQINGFLDIDLSELKIGEHTFTFKNPETLEEKVIPVTVVKNNKKNTPINAEISVYGTKVMVEVEVDKDATDMVEIKILEQEFAVHVNDGSAFISFNMKPGSYIANITYMGDRNFNPNSTVEEFTVEVKQDTKLITPNRVISVADGADGYDYQFILKDENGTALEDMDVTVSFNGKTQKVTTDEDGWGTVKVNANVEGTYDVIVSFEGDDEYNPVKQHATIKLVKEKTSFVAPDRVVYVQEMSRGYKYSAILKDVNGKVLANKKVLFKFNGKSIVTYTDEKGWATVTLTAVNAGTQTVTIKFAGDRYYRETSTTRTIKIVRESSKLTVESKTYKTDETKQITAMLKSKSDKAIYGAKLTLTSNGRTYTATTDNNGKAIFTIDIKNPGTYTAVSTFNDSRFFAATNITSKIYII